RATTCGWPSSVAPATPKRGCATPRTGTRSGVVAPTRPGRSNASCCPTAPTPPASARPTGARCCGCSATAWPKSRTEDAAVATHQDFIDYVAGQASLGDRLTRKKLFGEYALYVDGRVVAFACDNSLFVKPSAAVQRLAPGLPARPPYPGAKDYPVADELLDDA